MRKGFTLIELLVSVTGGLIIFLGILNLFIIARQAVSTGRTRAELAQNGRVALERVARDLRQAEEIVTTLPNSEIELQDGHDVGALNYVRYHLNGQGLYREVSFYAFSGAPDTRVKFNAIDGFGNPPSKTIIEDLIIAEYVTALNFSGEEIVNISVGLEYNNIALTIPTAIFGRNLVGS